MNSLSKRFSSNSLFHNDVFAAARLLSNIQKTDGKSLAWPTSEKNVKWSGLYNTSLDVPFTQPVGLFKVHRRKSSNEFDNFNDGNENFKGQFFQLLKRNQYLNIDILESAKSQTYLPNRRSSEVVQPSAFRVKSSERLSILDNNLIFPNPDLKRHRLNHVKNYYKVPSQSQLAESSQSLSGNIDLLYDIEKNISNISGQTIKKSKRQKHRVKHKEKLAEEKCDFPKNISIKCERKNIFFRYGRARLRLSSKFSDDINFGELMEMARLGRLNARKEKASVVCEVTGNEDYVDDQASEVNESKMSMNPNDPQTNSNEENSLPYQYGDLNSRARSRSAHRLSQNLFKKSESRWNSRDDYSERFSKMKQYLYDDNTNISDVDSLSVDDADLQSFLFYPYDRHVPQLKETVNTTKQIPRPKMKTAPKPKPKVMPKLMPKSRPRVEAEPTKCKCPICVQTKPIQDTPLIVEMKRKLKVQELRAYIKNKQASGREEVSKVIRPCLLTPCQRNGKVCNQITLSNEFHKSNT